MSQSKFSLQTEHIRLRAIEPEDLDFFYDLENDVSLWRCGDTNVPYSRYVLRRYLSECRNDFFADGQLRLVIENKASCQPVGCVDLMAFDPMNNRAEVGVAVIPQYRHCGVGKEALGLLLVYADEILHIHQLYAYVAAQNEESFKLFLSVGFTEGVILEDWLRRNDGYIAVRLMQKVFLEKNGRMLG
ncbi:MAG: GNAT family N-acetyltransferase [Clostridium sp.]|nr:GNAT family N-acetyltransferase [Clostridium sp.]